MKISFTRISQFLSTGVLVFAITLIATQSPVSAVTAKLAQANNEKSLNDLLGKMNTELTRRTTELEKSSFSLNGEKTGDSAATGKDSKECAEGDAQTKAAIDKTNKDSKEAEDGLLKLNAQVKASVNLGAAQQTAKDADAQYDKYKIANTQNNIMNALCTQKDAQQQLDTLIKQAQQKEAESGASGEGGGGGEIDIKEMISQVIQIAAAIAAIIASIVALVQAIQNNDMGAAAAIFTTIMTQLAAVADMLLGGKGEISEIITIIASVGSPQAG